MNKFLGFVFAITCFSTSALSNSIMGAGMWFWVIIAVGLFVPISQYFPKLREPGAVAACILGCISICAVLFGLVAATIGGSFRLEDREALLLFLFFIIGVIGITMAILDKKASNSFLA